MPLALTHDENLRRICLLCIQKIERGQERDISDMVKKKDGAVTTFKEIFMETGVYPDYEINASYLPHSLCSKPPTV